MTQIPALDAMAAVTRILFFDIEASGLHEASVPVELGWAWITREPEDGGALRVRAEAMLIRPSRSWREGPNMWDPAAEAIHGIARSELLDAGQAPAEVVLAFDRARKGKLLVSDTGPGGVDARWLRKPYEAASESRYPIIAEVDPADLCAAVLEVVRLAPAALDALLEIAPQASHRAAEDAARSAWIVATLVTLADMASPGGRAAEVAALGHSPRALVELLGDRLPKAPDEWEYRPMPGS